jgi:hypothetical protein
MNAKYARSAIVLINNIAEHLNCSNWVKSVGMHMFLNLGRQDRKKWVLISIGYLIW